MAWQLGLPDTNVLMASGGKFDVLASNTPEFEAEVGRPRIAIDTWLRMQFNGEVGVNLASVSFAGSAFQPSATGAPGFGEWIGRLGQRLGLEKGRRGQSILANADGWPPENWSNWANARWC